MSKEYSTLKSFSFAFDGIASALKQEPNFRIHIILGLIVLVAAYFLKFTSIEWLILILTIFFVLVLELINTTLEQLVDLVSPEVQPKAKIAKDVSAAAVLLSAIFSIIVGAILFLPKIF
jgi:diacylglycerol kinase